MSEEAQLHDQVRQRVEAEYAAAASKVAAGGSGCCSGAEATIDASFGAGLYATEDREDLPAEAVAASLGCGNPTAVAELRAGERVLDLGSGGGIDVLLSARRVGPTGRAYGLDMTEEMLALALANTRKAEVTNVDFLKGTIEAIPLPAESIDVVISNCVINLSPDKPAVFAETFRVLAPGGRLGISDVVADDALTPEQRAERGSYVGCIAGALTFAEYRDGLERAGFTAIEITPTHQVADGMHSAIVKATKPSSAAGRPLVGLAAEQSAAKSSCCGASATAAEPQAASPCCGTTEDAQASGSCCAAAAKVEAVAQGTGCC